MALSNTTDYGKAVNGLLYYIDCNFGGLDQYGLPIVAQIETPDWATLYAAYVTYKKTRDARSTTVEVNPTAHGAQQTTYATGGSEATA